MEIEHIYCKKCGKNKGRQPSLTVNPIYCEDCRKGIVPEDFEGSVAICMLGKAGCGKDTVADYLCRNEQFIRMALADPIRDIVQIALVKDHESIWDRDKREEELEDFPGFTVRKLLQLVGTELFRKNVSEDIWVRNLIQRLEPGRNYVITDVRFPNELDQIRNEFGGKTIFVKVVREGCEGKDVGIQNHESESYDLEGDIVIDNNGSLKDLERKIEKDLVELI